jgi:hypothetical protein
MAWAGEIDGPTDKWFAPALDSVPYRCAPPMIASAFAVTRPRPTMPARPTAGPGESSLTGCSPITGELLERVLSGLQRL